MSEKESYWKTHREQINERRRKRYKEDPEYRQRTLDASRETAIETRRVGLGDREIGTVKKSHRLPRVIMVRGKPVKLFSAGYFAEYLKYSPMTLQTWEKARILPAPTMVDSSGRKWYSERFMAQFAQLVSEFREKSWGLEQFKKFVQERWTKVDA